VRNAKEVKVAVVALVGTFDTARAAVGTIVVETAAPGAVYQVGLNGAAKTLIQLGPALNLGVWATRTTSFTPTPGLAGSGTVAYAGTVLNGGGAPVPRALVFVSVDRIGGAGPVAIANVTGQVVQLVEGADGFIATIQTTALGLWGFSAVGTPAATIATVASIDAATGGSTNIDDPRTLP
jgi:hypothetical protein